MSVTMMSEQTWTGESIDNALVKISTELNSLVRGRRDSISKETEATTRELLLYLEQYRTACTDEGRDLCRLLLSRCTV